MVGTCNSNLGLSLTEAIAPSSTESMCSSGLGTHSCPHPRPRFLSSFLFSCFFELDIQHGFVRLPCIPHAIFQSTLRFIRADFDDISLVIKLHVGPQRPGQRQQQQRQQPPPPPPPEPQDPHPLDTPSVPPHTEPQGWLSSLFSALLAAVWDLQAIL